MREHIHRIDVSDEPALLRLAEEVRASKEPRVLGRHGEDSAVVVPLPRRSTPPWYLPQ